MPEYFCGKCGKTFYQKSHSDAHQRRKTPCEQPANNCGSAAILTREYAPAPLGTGAVSYVRRDLRDKPKPIPLTPPKDASARGTPVPNNAGSHD